MEYKVYNGMVSVKISKRDYEEAMFEKTLDPNMDETEKYFARMDYLHRRDEDVERALYDSPDARERREAFVASLYDAITTDQESYDKKGMEILEALHSNNAQALLVALCGWNAGSIAKRARIIPDDGYEYYDHDPSAKILVHWSDGRTATSKCRVDAKTNKLYGYNRKVFTANQEGATITGVEAEVIPCFTKQKYRFNCITKEERARDENYVSYWYSTDPEEDRMAEPVQIIDNPYR